MKRVLARYIDKLADNEIFVFGSNTQGAHGGGAAKMAMNFGAIYGKPFGLQGKTFAIPTVDYTKNGKMSIESIKEYVNKFLEFTKENKDIFVFDKYLALEMGFRIDISKSLGLTSGVRPFIDISIMDVGISFVYVLRFVPLPRFSVGIFF